MSSVSGVLIDAATKQPIVRATIQLYDGNGNIVSGVGDESDTDGGFYIDSPVLDNPGFYLSATAPGYHELEGNAGGFDGNNEMYQLDTSSFSIPLWVWILIAVILVAGVMGYLTKLKKYI